MAALAYITPSPSVLAPSIMFEGRRRRIEDVVEWLLSLLDECDGDTDFEQTACETHGLGFPSDLSLDCAEVA